MYGISKNKPSLYLQDDYKLIVTEQINQIPELIYLYVLYQIFPTYVTPTDSTVLLKNTFLFNFQVF